MATTTTRKETHTIPNLSSRIDTTLPVTTEESVFRLMTATPCEYDANLPVAVYIHTRGLSEKSLGELWDALNSGVFNEFEFLKLVPGQRILIGSDGGDGDHHDDDPLNFIDEPLMKSYATHVAKFAVPNTPFWPRHYVVVDEADWRSKGVIVVALFEVLGYDEEAPDADPMEVHFSRRKNWSVDAVRFKSPKDAGMLLAGLSLANIEWEEMKRELRADELNCDVQDL